MKLFKRKYTVFFFAFFIGLIELVVFWRLAVLDDAYITYRYAANWAKGNGPVFNVGEVVEGYTTFLQVAFLVPFASAKAHLGFVSVFFSILFLARIVHLGYRKILDSAPDDESARSWAKFWLIFALTCPALIHWSLSGMETIWYAAALFLGVILTEKEAEHDRLPVASAVVGIIAALIRPDGVMLAGALALSWLFFTKSGRWKKFIIFSSIFALGYGTYFLWRYLYYGDFFPNTYYAKVGQFSGNLAQRGISYVIACFISMVFPVPLFTLLTLSRQKKITFDYWEKMYWLVIAGQVFQAISTGGDYFPYFRFLIPVLPLFYLLLWARYRRIKESEKKDEILSPLHRFRRFKKYFQGRKMFLSALALNLFMMLFNFNELQMLAHCISARAFEMRADAVRKVIPKNALIATDAIGALGYISNRRILDLLGLTDRTIAHTPVRTGLGLAGHEKNNTPYVLERNPEIILLCAQVDTKPSKGCEESKHLLSLPSFSTLQEDPLFEERYVFASRRVGKLFLSTYIRKDLIGRKNYPGWMIPE